MRNPHDRINSSISISSSSRDSSSTTESTSTVVYIENNKYGHCEGGYKGSRAKRKKNRKRKLFDVSKYKGLHDDRIMDAFSALCFLFRVRRVTSDGFIMRAHVFTAAVMLIFSIIVSAKQSVGNPIDCMHTREIPVDAFNAYCWIHSTYFVTGAMLGVAGVNVAFPGVASSSSFLWPHNRVGHLSFPENHNRKEEEIKVIRYYQWVAFLLLLQAILFYTPRWLWKGWEGGKIHALMMDLDIGLCSEVEKKQKKKMLLDYLWENLRYHNWWAYRYYLCEVLALVNVIGQMFLMNRFFDGAFLTFGIDVLRFLESDQEDRIDPMIYVFPRMTKCTFYKYGVSGEVERHDAVCILPLNVVNEKIYVFLWFWFLLLGILSLLTVIYRIVIIFSPRTRVYLLKLRFHLVKRDAVETIVRRSKVGDWFLLYMLGENLDTIIYRDVMHELANKLSTRHHHNVSTIKGELQEA
ncbi:innexin family member shaking B isoform X1 [Cotesia typhae]|uniref:innexin family member shaking B isoform X1 n=1 Tax=Cotesia typhae TaxID=2053667 RepID=UPI003D68EBAE